MTTANDYCVTDGLADVTLLDKSIPDKINRATFDKISREVLMSDKLKLQVKQFIENTKKGYQSIKDLINRRHALKRAIIFSNVGLDSDFVPVKTMSILEEKLTIAEIIERKKSLVLEKVLLERLKNVNFKMESDLAKATEKYNAELNEYINKQAELKSTKKDDSNHVQQCTKDFSPTNQPIRLDPIGIVAEIDRLTEYIESFSNELDRAISKSNATTVLVVS